MIWHYITKGKLSSKVYLGLGKATLERPWTAQAQLRLSILIWKFLFRHPRIALRDPKLMF